MGKRRESWRDLWSSREEMMEDFAMFDEEAAEQMAERQQAEDAREITADDVAVVIKLARERAALVKQMKDALVAENHDEALRLARLVCGLKDTSIS